jgi:hypothetical protein
MAVQDSVLFGCCLSVRPASVRVSQSTPFGTALASISRAYYQRFAASSTVTPLETILLVVGSIPNSGVSGENESVGEKFCQPFTLSSQLIVSTRKQSGQPTLLACRRLNRLQAGKLSFSIFTITQLSFLEPLRQQKFRGLMRGLFAP